MTYKFDVVDLETLCLGIYDCPHSTPQWQNEGVPVIRNYNLKDGYIERKNLSYVDEQTYLERVKRATPEAEDIIISREAPMGVVGIVPKDFKCCLGQRLVLLKINKDICHPSYLLYVLMSNFVQQQIRRIDVTGSIVSNLNISDMKKLKTPVYSLDEQIKIADTLSNIDEKIALNNQINATLEQMAKTLYDYWFVQFDFPDDNGKPYKSSGGEMVYNETLKRDIPKGWEVKTLNSLGEIVGGSTPSTTKAENFSLTDGTPWITPYDLSQNQGNKYITRGETNVTNQGIIEASLKKYPAGTVLMSSRAPIGYMAIAKKEVTTNQGFKSFIPNKGYDTEFVYYAVFNSMKAITQSASGSTFKEISTTVLKSIPVALPPKELAKTYFEKASNIFNEQDNLEQQNGELTKLRDWLLPMLMNGQITVQ